MISFCAFKTSVLLRRISRAPQKAPTPDSYRDRLLSRSGPQKEINHDFLFYCSANAFLLFNAGYQIVRESAILAVSAGVACKTKNNL